MDDEFKFIYEKEIWYVSAFINTNKLDIKEKVEELQQEINKKIKVLCDEDLANISWNQALLKQVIDCGKDLAIDCRWITSIEYFPFIHENLNLEFNTLGYLRFDMEYYAEDPEKKEDIPPELIQQIPGIVLKILTEFCDQYINQYLFIDRASPIYVFLASKKIKDKEGKFIKIEWSKENIERYKKEIGKWTEVYSGQWDDYTDKLYAGRVKNNLSNRKSELHYIKRNSGFIYMEEENYKLFFGRYMNDYVLEPTARARSLQFALTSINESLDTIETMLDYVTIDFIQKKIRSLRNLRGSVQTQMSIIYQDLDSNPRQHYTNVLTHLIGQFHISDMLARINEKFDVFHDSLEVRYREVDENIQKRSERSMNYLNYLFGFAVVAEVVDILVAALSGNWLVVGVSGITIALVAVVLILVSRSAVSIWLQSRKPQVKKTVDAVIIDRDEVALVKRKFPPFRGQFALPGGFIEKGESKEQAVRREAREETGLEIEIIDRVGVYDDPNRDPRGLVESTAYLCAIKGQNRELSLSDESTDVIWKRLDELKGRDLAFDHELILKDAVELISRKGLMDRKITIDKKNVLQNVEK